MLVVAVVLRIFVQLRNRAVLVFVLVEEARLGMRPVKEAHNPDVVVVRACMPMLRAGQGTCYSVVGERVVAEREHHSQAQACAVETVGTWDHAGKLSEGVRCVVEAVGKMAPRTQDVKSRAAIAAAMLVQHLVEGRPAASKHMLERCSPSDESLNNGYWLRWHSCTDRSCGFWESFPR